MGRKESNQTNKQTRFVLSRQLRKLRLVFCLKSSKNFVKYFYGSCDFNILAKQTCLPLSVGQSHFQFMGVEWYFSFFLDFNRTVCQQQVKILIRNGIMCYLIWVVTVCLCPIWMGLVRRKPVWGFRQTSYKPVSSATEAS